MNTSSAASLFVALLAVAHSMFAVANAQTVIVYAPVTIVDGSTPGYYNSALGTILDGTAPQFPQPLGSGGGDPLIYPSDEPNLAAATNVLGNWLTPHAALNANWQQLATIPATWSGNTETAIIYEISGGANGVTNLFGDFDADNGLFVWVNGQFKFGARGPGLPSPSGQFEYTNVNLGSLLPGMNRIQILREDNFDATGYQVRITGTPNRALPQNASIPVTLQSAAATFSQINPSAGWDFGVSKAINGTIADNLGWAIAMVSDPTGGITNQTAVFETATNVGFAGGSRLTFTLQQAHGIDFVFHTLGRFRISVTTDDRSTFADGMETGGDVTANWTVLNPDTLISSNGTTLNTLGDSSILASGTSPQTDTYVISATTALTGITGVRIEALEDASLPYNGPGRQPLNGNFVLSELSLDIAPESVSGCIPPAAGLVSWWPGEQATTDSVSSNHGILGGNATYAAGLVGSGFAFDGDRDGVSLGNPTSLQLQNFTIEAWIKRGSTTLCSLDQVQGPGGVMLSYGFGGYGFGVFDSGELFLTEIGLTYIGSPLFVTDTNYHHVAVTKAGGAVTFYLDGVASPVANYNPVFQFVTEATIGAVSADRRNSFLGRVDELAVYSRALSSGEIQSIVVAGGAGKCTKNPPMVNCAPMPTGAFAWWQAETNTYNSVGGGSGDFTSAAYNTGKVGAAFDFNVANNVVIADQPSFNPTNALTIECWVYPLALTVSYAQDLVSKDGEFSGPRQYMLTMGPPPGLDNGTGGFRAHVGVPGGFFYFIDGATKAQTNTWYHVAMTYDGAMLKLFVNGNLDAQLAVTGPIITSSEPIRLGGGAPGNDPAYFFNGRLDEVALYGRALSQSEIQTIYNSSTAGKCPLPPPPVITQHPANQTVNANTTAQFTVVATGAPTLRYQWFFAGNPLPGATNTSLSIPNALPINQGAYFVTVSNDFGFAISSNATLTVLTFPPVITRQPTNVTAIETTAASFSMQATGSVTLAYQWLLDGAPLVGKTTTTLSFTSVQFSNAGNYSIIVTNPYGAVTSSVATLTVNPRPPCAPVHDGLVSWWRGENDVTDAWDSNNGINPARVQYVAGKVGRAFVNPIVTVPDAASLRVTNTITLEAWVNPSSVAGTIPRVIISKFDNFNYSLPTVGNQSAYLLGTTNSGLLFFTVSATGSARTNTTLVTTNALPINQWSHVAATYDGFALRLYINGVRAAQISYSGGIFPGAAELGIGAILQGNTYSWPFSGLLDEVSIYNRALSAAEIQSIVAADLTGKCFAPPVITQQPQDQIVPLGEDVKFTVGVSGSRPLTYQWYFNGAAPQNRIIGATNASLIIEKVRTNNAGHYFVTVSNSVGTNYSVRAQLSTLPAPFCTEILPGLISWWKGDTNTLDVMGLNNISLYSPPSYPTGKVASAFTFNGINSRITVNNSGSLNFGSPLLSSNSNFSIEMWIKAGASNTSQANVPLFEKRTTTTTWVGYSLSLNQGRFAFALGTSSIIAGPGVSSFVSSGPDLRDAMFHHVAVTVNRSATNGGVLYVDGLPVLTFNPTTRIDSLDNTSPLYIGGPATTISNSYFGGLIDEPAIYNRALTAAEILSIRTAGAAGRCKSKPIIVTQPVGGSVELGSNFTMTVIASGTPSLRYQWRRNTAPVSGATNSILTLSNITLLSAGNYSVIVSNAFGSVTSTNAIVVITNRPPTALSGAFAVNEDHPIDVLLTGTDPEQNPLTYTIVTPPTNGVLSGPANNRFRVYTPFQNYNGPDFFTYKVNDGFSDSAIATMSITVNPENDAPVANSQLVSTDEDVPVAITLQASDIDGDALTYQITPPAHGTLSGIAPNVIYTPETNYFGDDLFTFTVTDVSNVVSQIAAVGITIRSVNDAPVAKIVITPLDELPGVTNTVLIAPACCDATLLLDGSQSTDVENDALTYVWLDGTNVIATTATTTNRFHPGTHELTLVVSDGATADVETMTVEIVTPSEAVGFLKSLVEDSITERRQRAPLVNWLREAEKSFERCRVEQGLRFLEMFQERVRDRIAPTKPEIATQLVDTAQAIIEAAPDCDPCHRLGRKGKRDHHDRDDHGHDNDEGRNKQRDESSDSRDASDVRAGKSSPR